jgi:hypothetical protein
VRPMAQGVQITTAGGTLDAMLEALAAVEA